MNDMKLGQRLIKIGLSILLGVGLFVGASAGGINVTPASAHVYDSYAAIYCGVSRPTSSYITQHAVPDHIQAEYVRYYCRASNGFSTYQWWVIRWWNNEWSMASGYQDCSFINCQEP